MPFSSSVLISVASVQGRRLGKVLIAGELLHRQSVALLQTGQSASRFLVLVLALGIQHGKAVEFHRVAGGLEQILPCQNIRLAGIVNTVGHQTGGKPVPNELVQPVLIGGQGALHLLRRQARHGGPDGLVGILGRRPGFEYPGLLRQISVAVAFFDKGAAVRRASSEIRRESVRI